MKYLFIDESYDQNVFIVGGIVTSKEEEITRTYNKLKKHLKKIPLTRKQKLKLMNEFKSIILDRSFPKIKGVLLTYLKNANIDIIYSNKKISSNLKQEKKEKIYLKLLKNIINHINDDIVIFTFDSFNNPHFNSEIEKEIKELKNVKEVLCMNSYDSKGLQFADNVVGTIRRHISGIDVNNDYGIISNKVISV